MKSWIIGGTIAVGLIACGGQTPSSSENSSSEELSIQASAASRTELGVTTWYTRDGVAGTVSVRGADAEGKTRVTWDVSRRYVGASMVYLFEHRVTRDGQSAAMTISSIPDNAEERTLSIEDQLSGSESLRRALELADADVTSGNGGGLTTNSMRSTGDLRPQETQLVTKCANWKVCRQTLGSCGKEPIKAALYCNPGSTAKKVVTKLGGKVIKWMKNGKDGEHFDPTKDCLDAVRGTVNSCDAIDEECDPVRVSECKEATDKANEKPPKDCSYCDNVQDCTSGTCVPNSADGKAACHQLCDKQYEEKYGK